MSIFRAACSASRSWLSNTCLTILRQSSSTYYKDELKKYGSVLECHPNHDSPSAKMNTGDSDDDSKLKCEGDQNGKTIELKAGTEQNQHIVSIKPGDDGKGSDFGLVYIRMRKGKDTI